MYPRPFLSMIADSSSPKWPAGNPDDPAVAEKLAFDASNPENSTDTANREKIARMVARFTFDVKDEIDPKKQYSKTMFFGDWLGPLRGEKEHFIEIQVKRIQGADPMLLKDCGISSQIVFLPMKDVIQETSGAVSVVDAEHGVAAVDLDNDKEDKVTSTVTEGNGTKAAAGTKTADTAETADDNAKTADKAEVTVDGSATSETGSFGTAQMAMALPDGGPAKPVQESVTRAGPSGGKTENTGTRPDFYPPRLPTTDPGKIELAHARAVFYRELIKRCERLEAMLPATTEWSERVKKSFVYVVKVIAIPKCGDGPVNAFTGPVVADRLATLLGMGGWVVPPLEERVAYRTAQRALGNHPKPDKDYTALHGLPKASVQRAMPTSPDRSDTAAPGARGDFAPLWMEVCDPTLEDVYWMVWQLFSGKQFIGFRCGVGFGTYRWSQVVTNNLAKNPFKSPSSEAIFHSANWKSDSK